MDELKIRMESHRRAICIFVFAFMVFINCCGFPLYNLNKEWPLTLVALTLYTAVASAAILGRMLRWLFGKTKAWLMTLATVAFSCVGLACRFLLECGEVSNTYNFTLPNVVLHVVAFSVLVFVFWAAREKEQ